MKAILFSSIVSIIVFSTSGNVIIRPYLDGRIVGGEATTIEEYPYQISLEFLGSHRCGGSILSPNVILTAAHCTEGIFEEDLQVRAGTTTKGKNGVVKNVTEILIHESYDSRDIDYDVSLLLLSEPLVLSSAIKPISLPDESEQLKGNESAVTSGWGALESGGSSPRILQKVVLPIVEQKICTEAYKPLTISPRMVCAGVLGVGGKDACQGDSGGPLAVNNKIHGIVSWGIGCAEEDYPGVYTRVTAVREWIRSKVNL